MRKRKKFMKNIFEKADKLCENREHIWEELFDDMDQCNRCGAIREK